MTKKPWLLLLGIIILGLVIRLYRIQSLPLYGDELTMVYDEYSILKTGMDSTGQKFPLTFKMGAGRPGGYIYFSIPFVAIFGPNVWGERSLSILSGLGVIILMYFLGKRIFGQKVGLVAGLLAAISPWDIYLRRGGFEAHFALFLALLGVVAFLNKKYIVWALTWGIAIFTYPTFKLTLPLMLILLVISVGIKSLIKNARFWVGVVILFIFGAIAIVQTLTTGSEQRFLSQNLFADSNLRQLIIQRIELERKDSTLPAPLKPIFINKGVEYGRMLFDNYVTNLSPSFFILRGDGNPRHNPGEMGMIYIVDLPLLLIGLSYLWGQKRKEFILILGWILLTPLATMLMPEAHGLRNSFMLPPVILGITYALTKIPKKYIYIVGVFVFIQLVYILIRVYTIAPAKFASFWSADAKKASLLAIESQKSEQKITLNVAKVDNIEYAYEVYAKIDPKLVIEQYGKYPKKFGSVTIVDK